MDYLKRHSVAIGTREAFLQDQPSHALCLEGFFISEDMLASKLNQFADFAAAPDGHLEIHHLPPLQRKNNEISKNEFNSGYYFFAEVDVRMEVVMEKIIIIVK